MKTRNCSQSNLDSGRKTVVTMVILTAYRPVLGYPIETAAFQGYVKVLSMLVGTIEDPLRLEDARADGVLAASRGNQIGTLELCL